MKERFRRLICLAVSALIALGSAAGAFAAAPSGLSEAVAASVDRTAAYVYGTVKEPSPGSIGGEWAVLGLARSGFKVPQEYWDDYYARVEEYVKACGGVLHNKKYTEYSRMIVALSSIGADARSVGGYDLTAALGDYDKTIWQGLNGPIWALIALDSRDYPMPVNSAAKTQATRQMYIDRILQCRLSDGGWSLFGGTAAATEGDKVSDPDITGMALQALAKYQDQPAVAAATREALDCMSRMQLDSAGFSSWGTPNSESIVQMMVALCELGIPIDDPRFVKNGKTMLDCLMTFAQDSGGFLHTYDGSGSNQMSTEQAFYGLVALRRYLGGENSLYRMGDAAPKLGDTHQPPAAGLSGKHADVKKVPVKDASVSFLDTAGSKHEKAILAMASRGIIAGTGAGLFKPDDSITRAQFAAMVCAALGLEPEASDAFSDVAADSWYAAPVGTAHRYGIVGGTGGGRFNPEGTISRQEAAVMAAAASELCGLELFAAGDAAVKDVLAQFGDYMKTDRWAWPYLAFCYHNGILDSSALNIEAKMPVNRAEVADMLYRMLGKAKLL